MLVDVIRFRQGKNLPDVLSGRPSADEVRFLYQSFAITFLLSLRIYVLSRTHDPTFYSHILIAVQEAAYSQFCDRRRKEAEKAKKRAADSETGPTPVAALILYVTNCL